MSDQNWVEVRRFPHTVTMIRERDDREEVTYYLIEGSRDVAAIDTGLGIGDFPALVARLSSRRPLVLQTHLHWDHVGASHHFDDVRVHPAEHVERQSGWPWEPYVDVPSASAPDPNAFPPETEARTLIAGAEFSGWLARGDRIDLGGRTLEVFHTPGHSRGSVSFLDRQARALFTGDLFYLGRMLLFVPGSDPAAFRDSLRLLSDLSAEVDVMYPAHGELPLTPNHLRAIRDAFEAVWRGRLPDSHDWLYGYQVATHDFGRFSFLLPLDDWRGWGSR